MRFIITTLLKTVPTHRAFGNDGQLDTAVEIVEVAVRKDRGVNHAVETGRVGSSADICKRRRFRCTLSKTTQKHSANWHSRC